MEAAVDNGGGGPRGAARGPSALLLSYLGRQPSNVPPLAEAASPLFSRALAGAGEGLLTPGPLSYVIGRVPRYGIGLRLRPTALVSQTRQRSA
jgi:hypothetical protein